MHSSSHSGHLPPVVIGGLGGSGTRLIASCLEELNFFIGHDLNQSKDNLWFTLLFKHLEILDSSDKEFEKLYSLFQQAMLSDSPYSEEQETLVNSLVTADRAHPLEFLRDRAISILSKHEKLQPGTPWGWKEPNSHIVLKQLLQSSPDMKYIYVIRNGLDMAHSSNQNQQKLWGKMIVGNSFEMTPFYSLKYWCNAHKRLINTTKHMGNNFLLLNYDNFCNNPDIEIKNLLKFLEKPQEHNSVQRIRKLIRKPSSIGRYRQFGTNIFDPMDVAYAKGLGFSTD